MKKTILFLILLLCFSCKDTTRKSSVKKTDSKSTKAIEQKNIKVTNTIDADSLELNEVLIGALKTAKANIHKNYFKKEYHTLSKKRTYQVTVNMEFGSLFSKKYKHLIVHLGTENGTSINVYKLKNNDFKFLFYRNDGSAYMNDTLRDVNGDNKKDFLVHWYPLAGCCLRNVYNVYLFKEEDGTFTKDFEFINPTFYPKEKIIRGVNYGYMASLYKYKWNKHSVDTLEFIIKDTANNSQYYITKKSDYNRPPIVKSKIVSKLPKEYRNIDDIDWFDAN
ncbi:hypothetical protein ACFFLS_04770 [Flavobacterium procerum]|uniref:Uncharacterized protein n=1 Tax=Flavobacterium procerum TaxID=1455569 RepID=A0ABV6BLN8_9FLAO